jgi:predicted permease
METILQDIRYGVRSLIKRPAFSAVAVITLALGIGANSAIFSLVNTVLLRPLPVRNPDEIVSVAVRGKKDSLLAFSYPNYRDFRDRNQVLAGLLVYRFAPLSLSREGNNERVWSYEVSGNYFDMLGVQALHGRTFLPEEDKTPLANPVVVLSYDFWNRRFGGDANLVGKDITLNNHAFKIIGVAPQGFKGTELVYSPDMWMPTAMLSWAEPGAAYLDERDTNNFFGIGRLKPGVSVTEAEASLNLLAQQLAKEYPASNEGQSIMLTPPGLIIPEIRGGVVSFTWILMAAVALVLFIACINLAGLLLARSTERRKEIAIRLAMGAGRIRLVRQLLTESILLSALGGVLGLVLAGWIINLLLSFRPPIDFPLTMEINVDWRVVLFSVAISLLTGAIFGLAPALQSTRPALVPALKDTAAQGGYRRSRFRNGLVVAQLALSLVLLIGAGLVARALQRLQAMNPGFETSNALTVSFDLGLQGYDEAKGTQFYREISDRVQALPGVRSVSLISYLPLSLNYNSNFVYIEGQPAERGANVPTAMTAAVGRGYFATMETPLVAGREFTDADKHESAKVVVVNETFARQLIPGINQLSDAVGRRISIGGEKGPFAQIVGIVRDGKYFSITEDPRAFVWSPLSQRYSSNASLVVRTAVRPESLIPAVRNEVRSLDPNLPVYDTKTMAEHMRFSLFPARIAAVVLGAFGFVALALAAIGIYGVTSYSVAQRTREIGVRIALGAQLGDVLKLIIGQGFKLTALGVALGLIGAFALTRALSSLLFEVSATDPVTFIFVSILLAAIALLASYIPARRATKVDPLVALRDE